MADYLNQALTLDTAIRAFHAATDDLPRPEQLRAMALRLGVCRRVMLDVAFLHYEAPDESCAREVSPEKAAENVLGGHEGAAEYNAYIDSGASVPAVFGL